MALAPLEIANELRPSPRDLGLPETADLNTKVRPLRTCVLPQRTCAVPERTCTEGAVLYQILDRAVQRAFLLEMLTETGLDLTLDCTGYTCYERAPSS